MNETTTPQLLRLPMGNDQLFRLTVLRHEMSLDLSTGAPDPSSLDAGTPLALDAPDIMNLRIRIYAVECGHRFEPKWRIEAQQLIIELEADKTLEHQKGIYRLELSLEEVDPNYIDGKRSLTLTRDLCLVTDESASTDGTPQDYTLTAPALLSASPELQKLIQSAQSGAIDEGKIKEMIWTHFDLHGSSAEDNKLLGFLDYAIGFFTDEGKLAEAQRDYGYGKEKLMEFFANDRSAWDGNVEGWEGISNPRFDKLGKTLAQAFDLADKLDIQERLRSLASDVEALQSRGSAGSTTPAPSTAAGQDKALHTYLAQALQWVTTTDGMSYADLTDGNLGRFSSFHTFIEGSISEGLFPELEGRDFSDLETVFKGFAKWMDWYALGVLAKVSEAIDERFGQLDARLRALESK